MSFRYSIKVLLFLEATIKTIAKTSLSGLQAVGGAVEVATGVALCSTGLGAIVGVPLILHGAANVVQGSLNTYNAATGNGKEAKNFMQEAYKWLGRKIGGEEGQKIANGVFTTVDLGLGVASVGGAVKLASKVEKIVTELKPGLIKNVFKATSSKASSIARTVKSEFGQLAKHYNKQSGTMLSSNIAGEGQKIYDTVKGYLKEKTAKTGAGAGEAVSKGTVKPVSNMNEFFGVKFGKTIKNSLSKSSVQYDGQTIYKVTQKTDSKYLKKGYGIYLDGLHKDHLEVIDKTGNVKYVLNLDGTLNSDKTKKALGRVVKGWR